MIDRGQLQRPRLPEEEVEIASLGGSVTVRGLAMVAALAMGDRIRECLASGSAAHVPELLAATVIASDGAPLWSVDEWDAFGAGNVDEVVALYRAARRVSGLDEGHNEKKAPNPS